MRLVSPVLKRMVYPILSRSGYLHRYAERGQLSVVTYHGVLPAGYKVMDPQLDGSWTHLPLLRDLALARRRALDAMVRRTLFDLAGSFRWSLRRHVLRSSREHVPRQQLSAKNLLLVWHGGDAVKVRCTRPIGIGPGDS